MMGQRARAAQVRERRTRSTILLTLLANLLIVAARR